MPLALVFVIALCTSQGVSQSTVPDPVRLSLELEAPTTGPGFAKCFTVERESQFVPGNLADVYIGDLILETDRFKAVIARPGKPPMGLVRGGSLMDITLSADGIDYFGSLNTTVDPTTTGLAVVYNKVIDLIQTSQTASITLGGYIGPTPATSAQDSEKIAVSTRYEVQSSSSILKITTSFTNTTTHPAWIRPADVIDWGEARVFTQGHGYSSTSSTTSFVVGAVDNFGLSYHTSGSRPMQGVHSGRDSLILAVGTNADYGDELFSRRATAVDKSETDKLPPEFAAIGASLQPGPGMVMFPGTETRYVMEAFGTPRKEPIYVPRAAIHYQDGKATVTAGKAVGSGLFIRPAQHADSFQELSAGDTYTFTRYMTVSDSNWASAASNAFQEKQIATGKIGGVVLEDGSARRIPDATVRISGGPGWNGEGPAPPFLQVKSRTDGTFVADVPAGEYYVEAEAIGRSLSSITTTVHTVKPGGTPTIAALTMTKQSHLRIAISEAETPTSSPLPVKLTLISKPPAADINYGFLPDISNGARNTRYLPHGAGIVPVTPGRYRLVVSRGIEYDILQRDIEILSEQDLTITGSLPHVMKDKLPGMVSMDAGVVTSNSGSGYANAESRVIQAACEGVQVIITGDYDQVTDLQQVIEKQKLSRWVKAFLGRRILLHKDGISADVFAYPLNAETSAALDKAIKSVSGLAPDIALADLKQQFPDLIFEISRPNHPEAGYLNAFPFSKIANNFTDRKVPPPDFNAIQLLEGKRLGQYPELYPPYINLQLSRFSKNSIHKGAAIAPSGSSFSHMSYGQEIGYPRTYLYLDKATSLADLSSDDITSAIRSQRFMVTNGPILLFDALDYKTGKFNIGPGQVLDLKTTEICRIRVRVLAAPWVTLSGVATKENGLYGSTVMINRASDNVERYPGVNAGQGSNVFAREIHSDTLLEATAFSDRRSLAPVIPDALDDFGGPIYPFAWSAPIFVDRNGDDKILINENAQ